MIKQLQTSVTILSNRNQDVLEQNIELQELCDKVINHNLASYSHAIIRFSNIIYAHPNHINFAEFIYFTYIQQVCKNQYI